jgi:hypothetical protein
MKKTLLRLFVLAVLVQSMFAVSAIAGTRATLVCRMGGSMVWSVISQLQTVPMEVNGKTVRVPVVNALFAQLVFGRGGQATDNGATLQPGSCGWTDRPMRANEPNRVTQNIDSFTFQETVQWGNGSTLSGATTMSGGDLNPQNKAVFSMVVTRDDPGTFEYQVLAGTRPTVIPKK